MATTQSTTPQTGDFASRPDSGALFEKLYAELHRIAGACMRGQAPHHSLQTTDLINEAYVRLALKDPARWGSRQHFLAEAARVMRTVLVDHARAKNCAKRTPPGPRIALDGVAAVLREASIDAVDFNDCLDALENTGEKGREAVRVAELLILGGFTQQEAADVLGMSLRSVQRAWKRALAWLRRFLGD